DAEVRVPRPYPELCTPRLLVLEYLDGIPIHDVEGLRARGFDLPALADRVARLYRRMLFDFGFFHRDPHPGHLPLLPDRPLGPPPAAWACSTSVSPNRSPLAAARPSS